MTMKTNLISAKMKDIPLIKKALALAITILIATGVLLAGCAPSATAKTPSVSTVAVKRGDIAVDVTSDGNLEMPNQFDLKFGTPGQVDQIFVEEGDSIGEGALLATMDCSSQINAVKNALLSIQTAKNNISLGCDTDHLPYNYPNLAVPRIMQEAQADIDRAYDYLKSGQYKDAGYWLVMTYFDIQVAEDLIKTRPDVAELAGAKSNSLYSPDSEAGSLKGISPDKQAVVDYLYQYRQRLLTVSNGLRERDYDAALAALESARGQMLDVSSQANSTVAIKNRMTYYYADTSTSVDFLQTALRYVQDLQEYIAQDDATAIDAAKKTYTAKLNLLVGLDVLQNQLNIFESGGSINWKTLQQYNINLHSAENALYTAKQNIMKTAIIAPTSGMAVSVNLKKTYVLSAQDYSAQTAVKFVDTGTVRFNGKVDEIDIMKVSAGQKADIAVDAIPGRKFTGTVRFISPYGVTSGNVIKFTVLIDLDQVEDLIRGGLSATATIHTGSSYNTLLVPFTAVSTVDNKSVVVVVDPQTGKQEPREVTVGLKNLEYAEILSGLNEGEHVLFTGLAGTSLKPTANGTGNPMRVLR